MASLSNINGIFDVHSTGAILFSNTHGTSGQILKSNGNAAPTWVAASTVIGGPYLPLSGGTLTGATATAANISFTVGGTFGLPGTAAQYVTGTGALATFPAIPQGDITGLTAGTGITIAAATGPVPTITNSAPNIVQTSVSGQAGYLTSFDTRSVNPDPEDYNNGVRFDFKANSTNGLSDGGAYNGQMFWRAYGSGADMSGGYPINIAYTANGNLWRRIGATATTWGSWAKFPVATGTTAQYIRGDGSIATFPAIPQGDITSIVAGTYMTGTSLSGPIPTLNVTGITADTASTLVARDGSSFVTTKGYNVTPGDGYGLRFWSDSAYKISMGNGTAYHYGTVPGYSIKTQMNAGSTDRGFTWGTEGVVPIAALNAASGNFQTAGTITAVGNITGQTFNGLYINTTGTNNGNNQIVRTQGNGYANFGWINSISGNHTGSITRITASNDAYLRYVTPAQFRVQVIDGHYAPATGGSYLPLAGGTMTGTLTMGTQKALVANNYGRGIYGLYSSTKFQHVWSMGTAYNLADGGSNTGNLYGLCWSYPSAGGAAANLNTHGLMVINNGGWDASLASSTRAGSDMRAPLFYDLNNTVYYSDLAGLSVLNTLNLNSTNLGTAAPSRIQMSNDNTIKYCDLSTARQQFNLPAGTFRRLTHSTSSAYAMGTYGWGNYSLNALTGTGVPTAGSGFFDVWSNPAGQPAGTSHWDGVQSYHHNNGSSAHGWQMLVGAGNTNLMYVRGIWGGSTWGSWYKMHNDNTSICTATNSFRAPYFYDSTNTAYYTRPASTSIMNVITFNGGTLSGTLTMNTQKALVANNYGRGVYGVYTSTVLQHVWSMGTAYNLADNGSSAGNLYGVAWSHPNAGTKGGANNLTDHGMLLINNGGFRAAISNSVVASSYVKGTQFIDWNNSAYYLDPASTSNLNAITLVGNLVGQNSYFNQDIGVGFQSGNIGGRIEIRHASAGQIGLKNNYGSSTNSGTIGLHQYTSASWVASGYHLVFQATPSSGSDINMLLCTLNGNIVNRNNSYGGYSDRKLKENIIDTAPKLEDLKRIKIRSYNFKDDPSFKQIGVIAQELEEVFPGLVEETEQPESDELIKSVKYSVFVPILIKAMQEQQVIIDDLKSRLQILENN